MPSDPLADLVTMLDMTRSGLALKHRANTMTSNIRRRQARADAASNEYTPVHLADILPLTVPVPALDLAPPTRVIWPDWAHPEGRAAETTSAAPTSMTTAST